MLFFRLIRPSIVLFVITLFAPPFVSAQDRLPFGNIPLYDLRALSTEEWSHLGEKRNPDTVTAIVLHTTDDMGASRYLEKSREEGWMVHLLIGRSGRVYGTPDPLSRRFRAAPGMDDVAVHIALEDTPEHVVRNRKQLEALVRVVSGIANQQKIPLNNFDVESKKGIFTHSQAMKRFGAFLRLNDCGGERVNRSLLKSIRGGKYYPEDDWKDRFEEGWVLVRENKSALKKRPDLDRGRGFTPSPEANLESTVNGKDGKLIQEKRLAYPFRGDMKPGCVVLHYTAVNDFQQTLDVLEERRLAAHIVVDKDGKAYQVMDTLYEKAAAASGTNDNCVQIEIVAAGKTDILQNEEQAKGVVRVVQELAKKFSFPLNNHRVESFSGVFSHTQAKKKWGRSVYLHGGDFDPGEPYMKKILEMAGGQFYDEENWYGRKDDSWTILYGNFQP